MPSEILFHHSLEKFLGKILPEGFGGMFLEPLAKELMFPVLSQVLMPLIPEEELHAFSEELRYAKEKGLGESTLSLQKEAREIHDHILSQLQEYFPKDWFDLSLQYYLFASEFQDDERKELALLPGRP